MRKKNDSIINDLSMTRMDPNMVFLFLLGKFRMVIDITKKRFEEASPNKYPESPPFLENNRSSTSYLCHK